MRILKNSNKTVFVISGSGGGGGCPRLVMNKENATLRDDYHGSVLAAKKILYKLYLV
jgi:hypothetical protein